MIANNRASVSGLQVASGPYLRSFLVQIPFRMLWSRVRSLFEHLLIGSCHVRGDFSAGTFFCCR